jgi:hypothetical protein
MSDLLSLTTKQLRRAADLKEKIAALTKELSSIFGKPDSVPTKTRKKRKKMSAAARAKISAAAKKRWAKAKARGKKSL